MQPGTSANTNDNGQNDADDGGNNGIGSTAKRQEEQQQQHHHQDEGAGLNEAELHQALSATHERLREIGADSAQARAGSLLDNLGFSKALLAQSVSELSGGMHSVGCQ